MATLYTFNLQLPGGRAMRCTIRATNWDQAEGFVRDRHPLATIERLTDDR